MRKLLIFCGLLAWIGALTVSVVTAEEFSREGLQMSPVPTPAPLQALPVFVLATPQAPPGWQDMGDVSGEHHDSNPLDQGADACPATVISGLPYTDSGTTLGRANNFTTAESCADYGAAAGPDVIYTYTPSSNGYVIISTCGSDFNTLVEVRTGGACPGSTQYSCADYGCIGAAEARPYLVSGTTYYIIVDGPLWNSEGTYTLSLRPMCNEFYHAGDFHECAETADSSHARLDCNGGPCESNYGGVDSYSSISCGQTYFGQVFTYQRLGDPYRDTDWYEFAISEPSHVTLELEAEFPALLLLMTQPDSCVQTTPYYAAGGTCMPIQYDFDSYAATYALNVTLQDYAGYSTPKDYRVTLNCTPLNGCVVDGTIIPPDTVFSTTIGAGNDCVINPTLDRTYRVNIPVDSSVWTFSMCNTNYDNWNPIIRLTPSVFRQHIWHS